jgi:hypothetical protein
VRDLGKPKEVVVWQKLHTCRPCGERLKGDQGGRERWESEEGTAHVRANVLYLGRVDERSGSKRVAKTACHYGRHPGPLIEDDPGPHAARGLALTLRHQR